MKLGLRAYRGFFQYAMTCIHTSLVPLIQPLQERAACRRSIATECRHSDGFAVTTHRAAECTPYSQSL